MAEVEKIMREDSVYFVQVNPNNILDREAEATYPAAVRLSAASL